MDQWELIDCMNPLEEDEENPRTRIDSESQLRAELGRFRGRKPGLVFLSSPNKESLAIGIGGPLSGLGWTAPSSEQRRKGQRVALAAQVSSPRAIDFMAEGIP